MNQQDEEILVMDYFRKYFEDFPKGKLVKSESPDFIIKISPKKAIGIELTRLDEQASSLLERIEKTLESKGQKFKQYQSQGFYALWLIIYTDYVEKPKACNLRNKMNKWKFISEFESVYLFDLFENRIYPINF